ncbi:MAG: SprB repeat-containing protein, partial [Saprospiraceae bacterium]|nr:SprB repeat-containing protein [Saprospiraceae bacterium]
GPGMPQISSLEVEQISDCGASDGEVVVDATGQNLEFSIDNNNWTSSNYFEGLDPGDYDVTVRVENTELCFDQFSFSLAGPEIPIISNVRATDQTDCEINDGTIEVDALGDKLEYRLDDGPWGTSSLFPSLGAGNYAIQIREQDHHGCLASTEIAIDGPALPAIVDIVARGPSDCGAEDGYIEIDAAGNQLEYSIDGGETWQSTNEFGDLKDGSYTAQIREANTSQCLVATNIELEGPELPIINTTDQLNPSDCGTSDGSIEISASGKTLEFTIDGTWSSNPIFQDLNAGTYLVRVREANTQFCIDTVIANLDSPLAPTIDDISITDPTQCGLDDGTILIKASGTDLEYSINDGSSYSDNHKFDGLSGGSLNVIVREVSSPLCLSETQVYLQKLRSPVIGKIEVMNPDDCRNENGSILIEAEGGNLEYSISNGENWTDNPKFMQLSGGNYQVIIRSHRLQSCEIKEEVALTSPENPVIEHIEPYHPDNCGAENGWLAIEATGINLEYSIDGFSWQSGKVFTNLGPGIYNPQVRIKETINCLVSSEVTLQTPLAPKIRNLETHDPSGCTKSNGRILVHADGDDLEYSIDQGGFWQTSKIFNNLGGGVYSIIAREKNQEACLTTANTQLSQPSMPTIDLIEVVPHTDCQSPNGSIEIFAVGTDLEYALDGEMPWQEESQFTGLAGGNYQVLVRAGKAADCMVSQITAIPSPSIASIPEVEIQNPSDCGVSDGQITIYINEEIALFSIDSVHWQSESVFKNLAADTYPIFVMMDNCVSRASAQLVAPEMPVISEIRHESPGCGLADGSILILASGDDLEYSIDGGGTFSAHNHFSSLASAIYELEVRSTNAPRCMVQTSHYLPESPPFATSVEVNQPTCHAGEDGKASIKIEGGTAPYRITWDDGTRLVDDDSFSVQNLTTGTYHLEIIDDANCLHLDTLTIATPQEILVATAYTIIDTGFALHVQILGGVPPYNIQWTSGHTDPIVFVSEPGLYEVTIIDSNGCIASDSILVETASCNIDWSAEVNHNQCYGDSLGSISILITQPSENLSYRWENHPEQNTSALSHLPAGTYHITMDVDGGCTTSGMIEVKQPDPLQLDIAIGHESKVDAADGWIDLEILGGEPPYSVSWTTSTPGQTLLDLRPGWYTFEIRDAAGCSLTDSIEILAAPACAIVVKESVLQPNCHRDGAISLDIDFPGKDDMILSWLDSSNLSDWSRDSLKEGIYYYSIKSDRCEIIDSVMLQKQEI